MEAERWKENTLRWSKMRAFLKLILMYREVFKLHSAVPVI
jgi:hypothetical protein